MSNKVKSNVAPAPNYVSINLSLLQNRRGLFLDYVTLKIPCLLFGNSQIDYLKVVLRSQAFNGSVYVDDTSLSNSLVSSDEVWIFIFQTVRFGEGGVDLNFDRSSFTQISFERQVNKLRVLPPRV